MSRKALYLLIFIGIPSEKAWAIPQFPWGPSGIVISSATGNQSFAWNQLVRSGGATIVAWGDGSSETLHAQRVSDDGAKLWPPEGILVTTDTQAGNALVIPDGGGGMLMTWESFHPMYGSHIYVQQVDQDGNRLFGDFGLPISTGPQDYYICWLAPDESGGGILTFSPGGGSPMELWLQRFDNSGNKLWGLEGVEITSNVPHAMCHYAVSDGLNGAIMGWWDGRKNDPDDKDIYIQRIDSTGALLWGATGTPVEATSANAGIPGLLPDGSGGVFVVWTDNRTGDSDVYAQRFDSGGNPLWAENGVPIVVLPGNQWPETGYQALVSDGSGGIIVFFYDTGDLYAQRVSSSGQFLWDTPGMPVARSSAEDRRLRAVSDGAGGAVLRWSPFNPWGNFIQRINSQGKRLWGTGGISFFGPTFGNIVAVTSSTFLFDVQQFSTDTGRDIFLYKVVEVAGPEPPSNLTATALEGRKIRLDWTFSPSSNVTRYTIYFDNGTGIIDYAVLLSSVPSSASTFTTDALTAGVTYKFGVRTVDDNDVEELNTDVVASAMALDSLSTSVQAAIKVPASGRKVTGNRVLIMAEIIQGSVFNVKNVRFQYRNAISTTNPWSDVVAATIQHPNPDLESPYFVHWDVSAFFEGVYELRAVATSLSDIADPNPPTIFITIDHVNPESKEIVFGLGIRKRQKIYNSLTTTVRMGDPQSSVVTNIMVPSNALISSTTTLRILTAPSNLPSVPNNLTSIDIFREITLENGQTTLNNPAILTFWYKDSDDDNFVDGTFTRADKLMLYVYDSGLGQWRKEFSSSVDTANKTVTAQTSHFSFFGLFAPAAVDLSNILVYPVPWVPNDGVADNGKPFNSADPDSGIIFDNITQSVKIQIFTITGELVWENVTDTSSGKIQWDAKNKSGRDVASGGYFAVITDTAAGTKVVRKLAVIR